MDRIISYIITCFIHTFFNQWKVALFIFDILNKETILSPLFLQIWLDPYIGHEQTFLFSNFEFVLYIVRHWH